jgi:hypothetical protein
MKLCELSITDLFTLKTALCPPNQIVPECNRNLVRAVRLGIMRAVDGLRDEADAEEAARVAQESKNGKKEKEEL